MTNTTVISAKNLSLTFETNDGPVHALKDVDLDIHKGDFVSFIGPSGCGKTSLLRMIAGHEVISAGNVVIEGSDVSTSPPAARPTSMMFQN
ncbi:MAG: ATP-binding cassette domain-containing protein, partial [Pseudomonadota bacterium]|nr:ATP-binding cassette domain-containing protein [Pseudomonadota bacterium]